MHFESKYDRQIDHPGFLSTKPSLTQQHFKDESDINMIIARYNRTGVLVDPSVPRSGSALFGDFSEIKDFQSAQNAICAAAEAFGELDSKIRRRFNNDPGQLISFLDDPANYDEGVKLGLFAPRETNSSSVSNVSHETSFVEQSSGGDSE